MVVVVMEVVVWFWVEQSFMVMREFKSKMWVW